LQFVEKCVFVGYTFTLKIYVFSRNNFSGLLFLNQNPDDAYTYFILQHKRKSKTFLNFIKFKNPVGSLVLSLRKKK